MANEIRRIYNFMGGEVEDNPLLASATSFQSAGLTNLPAVGSTEHVAIVFDPDWEEGAPFIKYITAHTAGLNTATITAAGQEGTTERQVSAGMRWALATTRLDYAGQPGAASGLIGFSNYAPPSNYSTTSTTYTAIDATNLKVAFTAPPSGKVLVIFQTQFQLPNQANMMLGVHDGTSIVKDQRVSNANVTGANIQLDTPVKFFIPGLTPGSAKTFTFQWKVSGDTGYVLASSQPNEVLMEVWAVNL